MFEFVFTGIKIRSLMIIRKKFTKLCSHSDPEELDTVQRNPKANNEWSDLRLRWICGAINRRTFRTFW